MKFGVTVYKYNAKKFYLIVLFLLITDAQCSSASGVVPHMYGNKLQPRL